MALKKKNSPAVSLVPPFAFDPPPADLAARKRRRIMLIVAHGDDVLPGKVP